MQGVRSRDQVPGDFGSGAVMDLGGQVPPVGVKENNLPLLVFARPALSSFFGGSHALTQAPI